MLGADADAAAIPNCWMFLKVMSSIYITVSR